MLLVNILLFLLYFNLVLDPIQYVLAVYDDIPTTNSDLGDKCTTCIQDNLNQPCGYGHKECFIAQSKSVYLVPCVTIPPDHKEVWCSPHNDGTLWIDESSYYIDEVGNCKRTHGIHLSYSKMCNDTSPKRLCLSNIKRYIIYSADKVRKFQMTSQVCNHPNVIAQWKHPSMTLCVVKGYDHLDDHLSINDTLVIGEIHPYACLNLTFIDQSNESIRDEL
jgi:hypothetical protein